MLSSRRATQVAKLKGRYLSIETFEICLHGHATVLLMTVSITAQMASVPKASSTNFLKLPPPYKHCLLEIFETFLNHQVVEHDVGIWANPAFPTLVWLSKGW